MKLASLTLLMLFAIGISLIPRAACGQSIETGAPNGAVFITPLEGSLYADLQDGENFGQALRGAGDLDRDGIPDLVVGAPGRNSEQGAVYLLWLNNEGWVHSWERFDETQIPGLASNGRFGTAVVSLGDLSGDGGTSFAVGAPGSNDSRGAVWLLYRSSDGLMQASRLALDSLLGLPLNPGARLGAAVGSMTLASGEQTLVVGIPGLDRVALVRLNASRQVRSVALAQSPPGTEGSDFGQSLDGSADGTGNGLQDLVVGAPGFGGDTGAVFLLEGGSWPSAEGWVRIQPEQSLGPERLGQSLSWSMDTDRDDRANLLIGSRDSSGLGAYRLLMLDGNAEISSQWRYDENDPRLVMLGITGQGFGTAMGSLGDMNSDHYPEIAFGLPGRDDAGPDRGGLVVLRLMREDIWTGWDIHYACSNEGRADRIPLAWRVTETNAIRVPDPVSADSATVEVLFRRAPVDTPLLLRLPDGQFPPPSVRQLNPDSAGASWTVLEWQLTAPDSFRLLAAPQATGAWLHVYRSTPLAEPHGTKTLFTRYSVAPGQRDQRFLTTVLFSNPRNIGIEVALTGLAPGKVVHVRAAVRDSVQYRTLTGTGDSLRLETFEFPGIPGSIHGIDVEVTSPNDGTGGQVAYSWAGLYPCDVICQPPQQRFFHVTGPEEGRLTWQRIPTGGRTYAWGLAEGSDTTLIQSGYLLSYEEPFPGVDIDGLTDSTTYRFRVRNDCADGGWAEWSDWTEFVFPYARLSDPAESIEGQVMVSKWRVHPNPASDAVWLAGPGGSLRWTWYTPDGQFAGSGTADAADASALRLDMPAGPDGVYWLHIDGPEPNTLKILRVR